MISILPVPAVNAAIFNEKGEILLTRRSPRIREPGKWCLPGGHVEKGEFWERAMCREIREEVGLEVKKNRLIGLYSDPQLTLTLEPLPEGYRVQFVVALFAVTDYVGEVVANEEVDAWDWFRQDRLPEPMVRSHPIRVKDALAFQGKVFVR
jgi:glycerol-1-phosphatase